MDPLSSLPDEQLMSRFAAGDAPAFVVLYHRHAPRVAAFLGRTVSDATTVEDLLQQVFLKLHRSKNQFDSTRAFRPWMFTIASSIRKDWLRARYRLPPQADEDEIDRVLTARTPPEVPLKREADRAAVVREAVAALPESQRVVVQLHRFEHMTFEEIAEVLGTSPGAVRVRASRAYETLRDSLRQWHGEGA